MKGGGATMKGGGATIVVGGATIVVGGATKIVGGATTKEGSTTVAPPVAPRWCHFLTWPADHTTEFGQGGATRY